MELKEELQKYKVLVNESWDTKMKTPASKKGMFKGKTKAELRSELATLKARSKKLREDDKPEPQSLKTKIKEVEFALRAKNSFGKVSESAINESALSFSQILAKYPNEIRAFEEEGEGITDEMFNDLYEYYVEDMPYGTAKARTGDPYQWIEEHFLNDLGRHTPASVTEAKKTGSPLKKKRIPGPFSKKIREDIGDQDYSGGVPPENDQTGRPCMLCNTPVSWKNNYSLGPNGAVFCGKCLNADKEAVRAHWKDIPARSGRSMAPYQYGSVAEGAVHNFLDKMSAAARNFFHRLANKSGCSFETLMWRLSALDPDTFSVQDIAGLIHCSERSARSIANIAVRQGIFNKNGNSYSLAKREVTEVRVAAKVAKSKEENPENFCKVKNCLWRTKEDFCPKHAKKEAVKESTTNRKSGPWSKK